MDILPAVTRSAQLEDGGTMRRSALLMSKNTLSEHLILILAALVVVLGRVMVSLPSFAEDVDKVGEC